MYEFIEGAKLSRAFELYLDASVWGKRTLVEIMAGFTENVDIVWGLTRPGPGDYVAITAIGTAAELDILENHLVDVIAE